MPNVYYLYYKVNDLAKKNGLILLHYLVLCNLNFSYSVGQQSFCNRTLYCHCERLNTSLRLLLFNDTGFNFKCHSHLFKPGTSIRAAQYDLKKEQKKQSIPILYGAYCFSTGGSTKRKAIHLLNCVKLNKYLIYLKIYTGPKQD